MDGVTGFFNGDEDLQRIRHHLQAAWRIGVTTPRLTWGWTGLILGLGGLRLSGGGDHPALAVGGLMVIVIGLAVWQVGQIGRSYGAVGPNRSRWRRLGAGVGLGVSWGLLGLPLGLWGLGSRVLVHLSLPAAWINWVSLYRHPLAGGLILGYGLLGAYSVIWGPRHWRLTKAGGSPRQMLGGLGIFGLLMLGWLSISWGLVWLNRQIDPGLPVTLVRWVTAGSMVVILGGYTLANIYGILAVIWSWCGQPALAESRPTRHWRVGVLGVVWVVISVGVVTQTLQQPRFEATTRISHRGVDRQVGVQNTVGALRHVATTHPQYVEMDLHETRDHRWVVLHDENLKALARRNVTPHQLTCRQLTRLTLREHGHTARLVSWPHYLRVAEQLRQPLLVELKTTPADSKRMIQRFAAQYGRRLVQDHSAVHSMDYRVVAGLRKRVPQLRVGYITPFNWVAPSAVPADFYSFQQISVSDQFIQAAHRRNAAAYLWTPDSAAAMTRAWALGADGQITNQVSRLKRVVAQRPAEVAWAVVANFVLSYI